jgi:hypothetical protein
MLQQLDMKKDTDTLIAEVCTVILNDMGILTAG